MVQTEITKKDLIWISALVLVLIAAGMTSCKKEEPTTCYDCKYKQYFEVEQEDGSIERVESDTPIYLEKEECFTLEESNEIFEERAKDLYSLNGKTIEATRVRYRRCRIQ